MLLPLFPPDQGPSKGFFLANGRKFKKGIHKNGVKLSDFPQEDKDFRNSGEDSDRNFPSSVPIYPLARMVTSYFTIICPKLN